MPNEEASSSPELSELEKENQRLQGQMMSLAADEARTHINKFIYVYGLTGVSAVWALYSALTTTLAKLQPHLQPAIMEAMVKTMQKKLDGLNGKPPEPEPETASEPEKADG